MITTGNGAAALAAASSHNGRIALLLTDVVMPGMSGRDVAEAFRKLWPKLKVLYASGYSADTVIRYGVESAANALIEKPFKLLVLARKVRQTLDNNRDKKSTATTTTLGLQSDRHDACVCAGCTQHKVRFNQCVGD